MLIYPNAKINIGLRVTEKRRDGYHNIETAFYPIPLMDGLEITAKRDDDDPTPCQLRVQGAILDGGPQDNLVVRAYELLRRDYPEKVSPLAMHLFKHIPTGAGLGGGSSDGAFALKALNERFALGITPEQLVRYAARLGADCPFFLYNTPMLARGIGDQLTPLSLSLTGKKLVIVKPDISVSTREAYQGVIPQEPDAPLPQLLSRPIEEWAETVVNDFEPSVFSRYPEIAAIKDRLYDLGALYASMSGSGSCVYGIFSQPVEFIDEIFAGYFCRQRTLEL